MSRASPTRGLVALSMGVGLFALASGCRIGPSTQTRGAREDAPDLHTQIDQILRLSAAAWNGGELAGFMIHYHRAPTTTYIGAGGLLTGFERIEARYAPSFAPGARRDSLRFVELRTRPLGQDHALATARYVLSRNGETTSTGPFTLLFLRVEGAWKIIHDQSALDPPAGADSTAAAPEDSAPAAAADPESGP